MVRLLSNTMMLSSIMNLVLSGEIPPDLCRNPHLDSIVRIRDLKMYFFTSAGYYWLMEEKDFPPLQKNGKKLPNNFMTGQAAYYMDTLKDCSNSTNPKRPEDKQIYILEKTENGNQLMMYDILQRNWTLPKKASDDHIFGKAEIDYEEEINAMFEYKPREIYFVQKNTYAAVDYKNFCMFTNAYADPFQQQNTNTINTTDKIDAMTLFDPSTLLMLSGDKYYNLDINQNESKNGKIVAVINQQSQQLKTFLGFKDQCPPPFTPTYASTPALPTYPSDDTEKPNKPEESGGSNGLIIIGVIVVIVIVAVIIGVVIYVSMNKKKASEGLAKTDPETNKVETAPKSQEKVPLKIGTNAVPVMATTTQPKPPKSPAKK